jgi:hypothetical protein
MLSTQKGIVLALCLGLAQAGTAFAEPSYLIYPSVPTVFRYDTSRYEVVGSGDAPGPTRLAIRSYMLWDRVEGRIPYEVYGAPQLVGFEPATDGTSRVQTSNGDFDLVVDGLRFAAHRRQSLLALLAYPSATPCLTVDGVTTDDLTVPLLPFEVNTPVQDGYYSNTRVHHVSWRGGSAMEIVAFSDKDGDRRYTGTPLYRIVAHVNPVATQPTTWGSVKALYR